ncbi:MAG TPA: sigma-70 family RNA polymerase sigma factor [Candidatus Xenobia bacterium]|jgi:RNA polymerase sigma-70 factor (ECF subfamily)
MQVSTGVEVSAVNFEQDILRHLDSAYNLARWLVRSPLDAEDVVQEAVLRAFKYFRGCRGGDTKAWFLRIVRNTATTWLAQHRPEALEEEVLSRLPSPEAEPDAVYLQAVDGEVLRRAIESLPTLHAEALVLREIEGLSYKAIADVADVPIGTVMSRLARARKRLQEILGPTFRRVP